MKKYNLDKAYPPKFFTKREHWKKKVYKIMAEDIDKMFNPNSVIDIGCGSGFIMKYINADKKQGIEGTANVYKVLRVDKNMVDIRDLRNIIHQDYPLYDIAVSIEVAEHIEPQFANTFVENLCNLSHTIILTAAPPNQGGNHHVNCQPKEYWKEKFKKFNFQYSKQTDSLRNKWKSHIPQKYAYLYNNLMVFKKGDENGE
jgi:hypothetical protein